MQLERTLFLTWLIYLVVVSFATITGVQLGYIQVAIDGDPTFITIAIILTYIFSECFIAWNVWKVDTELGKTKNLLEKEVVSYEDLPEGMTKEYVTHLKKKIDIDHKILLEALVDRLYAKNYGPFMGDLVVRLGLLGTIIGLIMAFMPFLEQTFAGGAFTPEQIQSIITSLFKGISAAFFTTAAGIVCGTLLTISGRIYETGADKLIDNVAILAETKFIPDMEE